MSGIACGVRNSCLAALVATPLLAGGLLAQDTGLLEGLLRARIAQDTATVAVAFRDSAGRDEVEIGSLRRYHAASTMKVPVLLELARRVDAGDLKWNDRLPVHNRFKSIVDGSPFSLDIGEDSDSSLYRLEGSEVPISRLARLMITRSSNLATDLIIERLDPKRVNATAHQLGADSIAVLRGVEDLKAFELGLNNTTTARDLAILLQGVACGRVTTRASSDSVRAMLLAQEFNDGIPAGLPAGTPVAHKTGEITAIAHDAAIVYPPGRAPYILVILTRGYPRRDEASRLMADLSGIVYRWVTQRPDPHE
jgi:beta-lactamase class A